MKRCCSGGILPLLCRCHGIGDHVEQAVTEFPEAVGAAICDPAGKLEAKTVCDAEAMALVIMWSWLPLTSLRLLTIPPETLAHGAAKIL